VNDASRTSSPGCLPSDKNLCPATPSRASGSGVPRLRSLATAMPVLDAFSPPRVLADPRGLGPRPRAPLPTGDTLLWTSVSLADFCNLKRRAGTPYERSTLAREWSFRPATRRHQPMPVALVPRRVAAPETCEPRSATHQLAPMRSTCVDGAVRGPRRSSKGEPRALGRCRACPSRDAPGTRVTGSIRDEVWRTSPLFAPA